MPDGKTFARRGNEGVAARPKGSDRSTKNMESAHVEHLAGASFAGAVGWGDFQSLGGGFCGGGDHEGPGVGEKFGRGD